jgi:AraC-like DNA-binding protein
VLLGAPAAALAGSLVPLEMPQAYDDMAVATTWSARFDVLDAMLLGRAAACDRVGIRGELAHAWQRIARTHGTVRVGELADEVGWSRRHLTERFTAEYGIGPKQAARIARFQRARALLEGGSAVAGVAGVATVASVADVAGVASVADVATRCGYADQAHLTRDFRALGGCTPTQWRRESLSFVQDGAAAG